MTSPERPTLLEYPCEYVLKVMGPSVDDFTALVEVIVARHVEDLAPDAISWRASSGGRYLSVSVRIDATSQAQLDGLYRELSAHERVLMVL